MPILVKGDDVRSGRKAKAPHKVISFRVGEETGFPLKTIDKGFLVLFSL